MSKENSALYLIPARIRYYLLDWKDNNLSNFLGEYRNRSLHELSKAELLELFRKVVTEDFEMFE